MRDGQAYEFYGRLGDMEDIFIQYGFIRTHNSFLVNSAYVLDIKRSGILLRDCIITIPVSRGSYQKAYEEIAIYAARALIC